MPALGFVTILSKWALFVLAIYPIYLVFALYVFAPLGTRKRQAKSRQQDYISIELPDLPPEVAAEFYANSPILASLGFESIGHVSHHVANTRQNAYISVWVNRATGDTVQIIAVCTPSVVASLKIAKLVTFRTEFTDGTMIGTTNTKTPGVFPPDPKLDSVRCEGIWFVPLLYQIHLARVARNQNGRKPTLDRFQDAATRLQLEFTETYERLIAAGYYAIDATSDKYVPTYKGAFFMCYKLLPPFKQIRKLIRDRKTNRTLQTLGFGNIQALIQSQSASAPPNQIMPA